jgi:hypothetical protein
MLMILRNFVLEEKNMYLWSLTIVSSPKPPHPPTSNGIPITTVLIILVIVALISLSIGFIVALMIRPGRKGVPPPPEGILLNNKRWLGLAEEDVALFSQLDDLSPRVDAPRQEMIGHVKDRLQEILARSGVEVISRDEFFDAYRHQLEQSNSMVAPGTRIAEIVSPGFAVSGRVLRPARVRVMGTPLEGTRGNKGR